MRVPLTGGAYQAKSIIANAQRCVNLYPEANPPISTPPVPVTHYLTPGLKAIDTTIVDDGPGFPVSPYPSDINTHMYILATGTQYGTTALGYGKTLWPHTGNGLDSLNSYNGLTIPAFSGQLGPFLAGSSTGLTASSFANIGSSYPYSFDIDLSGQAYIISRAPGTGTEYSYTIRVFAFGATGDTAPVATITGSPLPTFDSSTDGEFPASIALDAFGNFYVAIKNVIYKFTALVNNTSTGSTLATFGEADAFDGMCFDNTRSWLWIADRGLYVKTSEFPSTPAVGVSNVPAVYAVDLNGVLQRTLTYSGFICPSKISVGLDGTVYVGDAARYAINSIKLTSGVNLVSYPGATAVFAFDKDATGAASPIRTITFPTSGTLIYNPSANPPEAYISATLTLTFSGMGVDRDGNLALGMQTGALVTNGVATTSGILLFNPDADGFLNIGTPTGSRAGSPIDRLTPVNVFNETSSSLADFFTLGFSFKGPAT